MRIRLALSAVSLLLTSALTLVSSACKEIPKGFSVAIHEGEFASQMTLGTALGPIRFENDSEPNQIGSWFLASEFKWVVRDPNGGTVDIPVTLPASVWVRDTDLFNRENELHAIFAIEPFKSATYSSSDLRGLVFLVKRGMIIDASGNQVCAYRSENGVEFSVSNKITSYVSGGMPNGRLIHPGDFQNKGDRICGFPDT